MNKATKPESVKVSNSTPSNKPLSVIEAELYEVMASKELSFGCNVDLSNDHGNGTFVTGKIITYNGYTFRVLCDDGIEREIHEETMRAIANERVIIGHEPRLEDVLLKLNEIHVVYRMDLEENELLIDISSQGTTFGLYDLTKSFDNQTDETKRKIHNLICK